MKTYFVSGHLTISNEEFETHYVPLLEAALAEGATFVVGDAWGVDARAQVWIKEHGATAIVFHAYGQPRNNAGFPTRHGFDSQGAKDAAMTDASDEDIAWVRPGREDSGTARNIAKRLKKR